MNIDMIENYLMVEGLQKVYHATSYESMLNILIQDEIKLTPNMSTVERAINDKYFYFLSTMRNKTGSYLLGISTSVNHPMHSIYMVLNADKLSNNLKHMPVDYWGLDTLKSEEEERFFSNRDVILNASTYIESIHVLLRVKSKVQKSILSMMGNDSSNEDTYKYSDTFDDITQKMFDLNLYSKNSKIPIYFYDEPQNYIAGKKAITLTFPSDIYLSNKQRPNYFGEYVKVIIKIFNNDKLSRDEFKTIKDRMLGYKLQDTTEIISQIGDYIHRERKSTDRDYNLTKSFINIMKQYKMRTISDFYNSIVVPKLRSMFTQD